MKQAWLILRCILIWFVSWLHFIAGTAVLFLVAVFVDPRTSDPLQRQFCRNIAWLAGVRLQLERSPRFDPGRTVIFVSNHVNLFDPFILYAAIPQYFRGWELESHFKIPIYGWLMKRFGNIPVAVERTPGNLRRLIKQTRQALDNRTSLMVFPEGKRTLDGRVQPFEPGIFRIVRDLHVPIVPVSMVGAFEFNRKGSFMLRPATILIRLHDPIETKGLSAAEAEALPQRVYQIVSAPVHAALHQAKSVRQPAAVSHP